LALFLATYLRIWLLTGLDLAPWQKVDLATLSSAEITVQFELYPPLPTYNVEF